MFSEVLDRKPMPEWLTGAEGVFCPEAGDPAWNAVDPALRQEITLLADAFQEKPYPMRTASGFLDYARTGSRSADETPYFFRRRKLCGSALACCVDESAPLDEVLDGIWCICEETSWVISAHNINPVPGAPSAREYPLPDPEKPYVDLFAAQTGMILSFVRKMLEKQLDSISPIISRRIAAEMDRRILNPFLESDDFWWMGFRRKDLCNWTPWIISNVMVCAFLRGMPRDALAKLLDRACRMLDRWLDVVPEDGGCDEGAGYWNMAGGALLDCLEMLENATEGKLTFWQNAKIRSILTFPEKAALGGGWFMNFADCDARPFLSGERLQLAGEKLEIPSLVRLGKELRGTLADQLNDVPHLTRVLSLLFHPVEKPAPLPEPLKARESDAEQQGDVWLPDLQVRRICRGGLTLCCKGGHNGENHNHNDVGSFMLYADGQPVFVDAGNLTYTAKTFSDQRYTIWNVRSAYHNVPLIGGMEQQAGRKFAASGTEALPDGLELDMADAYPEEAGLLRCRRVFRLAEDRLTVEDWITLREPRPVVWTLLLRPQPQIRGSLILAGPVFFSAPDCFRVEAEEIPITDSRMARSFPGSLWRLSLTAPEGVLIHWTLDVRTLRSCPV